MIEHGDFFNGGEYTDFVKYPYQQPEKKVISEYLCPKCRSKIDYDKEIGYTICDNCGTFCIDELIRDYLKKQNKTLPKATRGFNASLHPAGPKFTITYGNCDGTFRERIPLIDNPGIKCHHCGIINIIPVGVKEKTNE